MSVRSERPRRPSSMPLRVRTPEEESVRDQVESSFTRVLRRLWIANVDVLAVVLVDSDGECVDYCSSLPPFDAKVAGAHLRVVVDEVRRFAERIGGAEPSRVEIHGTERDLIARRLGDGYLLVVVVRATGTDQALLADVEDTADAIRREAGLPTPAWDPEADLEVQVRRATGWDFAPRAFVEEGRAYEIASVLGRWEESGPLAGDHLVCFRVQTVDGIELTLAYDPLEKRWLRW
ncbi:MAG: hypothetical protein MUE69_10440 [Myxococcota bacterium]|nr:hypothetical protein [Myxococcota bacterium]